MVRDRGSLPGLPVSTALAGRLSVSALRACARLARAETLVAVCQLRAASNRPRAHWCFDKPVQQCGPGSREQVIDDGEFSPSLKTPAISFRRVLHCTARAAAFRRIPVQEVEDGAEGEENRA